jgi:cytochrome b
VTLSGRVRVWDAPTRIFHWLLASLVMFSFITGKVGGAWMEWHLKSGYAILTLLLFRLAWGIGGSPTARFAQFLRGPRATLAYAREIAASRHSPAWGHNPMGGWMVVLMLAIFLFQACTGLFADDDISTQGPLAVKVSNDLVSTLTSLHKANQWVMGAAVALHLAAIAFHRVRLGDDLVGPMLHGWKAVPPGLRPPEMAGGSTLLAGALLAASAAFVYWLVVAYPKG